MARKNLLLVYQPLEKQKLFHDAGSTHIFRALFAGNQYGKTKSGCAELATHATGLYDDLSFKWSGRRFEHPVDILLIGHTFTQMIDSCQRHLFGREADGWGTGMTPSCMIAEKPSMNTSERGLIDHVFIHNKFGGTSKIRLASETQGQEAIMGSPWHVVAFDEIPKDLSMFSQSKARITKTEGIIMMMATPEEGWTEIVALFMDDERKKIYWWIVASAKENTYLNPEYCEKLWASYSPQERTMRIEGLPIFGSGMIYPYDESQYVVPPFKIPDEWPRIGAVDPGFKTSKTPVGFAALDDTYVKNLDDAIIYIYDVLTFHKMVASQVADGINQHCLGVGYKIPISCPKDANSPERSSGTVYSQELRKYGVNVLSKCPSVRGIDGKESFTVWDGIQMVQQKLESEKLKIFHTFNNGPLIRQMKTYSCDEEKKIMNKSAYDYLDMLRYLVLNVKFAIHPEMVHRFERRAKTSFSIYN